MPYNLPDYRITDSICEGWGSNVYRATRKSDGLSCVLKILPRACPTPDELARFRREYDMTRLVNTNGVIRAFDFVNRGNTLFIVLEDFGGESLDRVLSHGENPDTCLHLETFLDLGIRMAGSLEEIHGAGVIHKDINPSNSGSNAMEQIYGHIAREPVPVHVLNPKIPAVISSIVGKLLEKNPEDRYQSMFGLVHDLALCRAQLQEKSRIDDFEIGVHEVRTRFVIPQVLYGREKELETLKRVIKSAFDS